jgi:ABC-type multidrug transport system fused ATPase/permease subunit
MTDEGEAEAEVIVGVSREMERTASQRAWDRARNARWDLNIAIFLFAVLILVIILVTYTKMGIEVVAPVALFGLAMVWLTGWKRGKQLYQRFYDEELSKMEQELKKTVKATVEATIEETIEEKVQKALRERWK